MSTPLAAVDLTGVAVGAQRTIDFSQYVKVNPMAPLTDLAALTLFNESGSGLQWIMQASGRGGYLPAGGWLPLEIHRNDSTVTLTVIYTLPGAPVSQLLPTYYAPGEFVPPMPILGNSPIGIGGTVNTSTVQTLSNEGNAAGVLVLDWGPATPGQVASIWNDHFVWSVVQSGVAHQVLKGQTAGNPLQIGQAGDTTEVLGQLLIDQLVTLLGNILLPNNTYYEAKDSGGVARGILAVDASNNTILRGAGAAIELTDITNVIKQILTGTNDGQVAGQTSGTATLYQPFRADNFKVALLVLANYKNTANQTLALPTPFTAGGTWYLLTGLNGHIALLSSGVGQIMRTIVTLAAGGGTTAAQGFAGDNSFGFLNVAWDTIQLQVNTAPATGPCLFVGL